MKKEITIFFLMITFTMCSCQTLKYGTYESHSGSILEIKKNKTFHYLKSNHKIDSDVISLDSQYEAYGKFKKEGNLLYLTSDKLKLEDNPDRGITFNIKEIIKEFNRNSNDFTNVTINYDKDLFKIFLCNTFNEVRINSDDVSNCFKLKNVNNLHSFFENYFIRIYPNIDNHKLRTYNINSIYFDSNYLKKEIDSDLVIDITFDITNFGLVFFNKEIMIIEGDKIYHEGQEFVFKEGSK